MATLAGRTGGDGGRIPDLVVWDEKPERPEPGWLPVAGVLLFVEIVSKTTRVIDTVAKHEEYAAAGVPHYWIVDQDPHNTVALFELTDGHYRTRATMALVDLLETSPNDYLS